MGPGATYVLYTMSVMPSELCDADPVTINMLPDDVLLDIFDFYRMEVTNYVGPTYTWHRLAHVCRRWRDVVFASPNRLDLRILCTERTPVRELLDIWPHLPIVIRYWLYSTSSSSFPLPQASAVTALEHHDRICELQLSHLTPSLLSMLATALQEPYPPLTTLELWSDEETAPVLSDTFLGGSAPRLERIWLEGVAFPALPKLLLSTGGLVSLLLDKIPLDTGYISPEVMATTLSKLTKLKFLRIEFRDFRSPGLPPDIREYPQQLTRVVLPCLTWLEIRGVSEYVEDLMARIEAPLLENINIKLFNQLIFVIPQLLHFITYSEKLNCPNQATVDFQSDLVQIALSPPTGTKGNLILQVLCKVSHWQVSAMVQICNQALPLLTSVERLEICGGEYGFSPQEFQDNVENAQWLELFYPFIAVESLHVAEHLGSLTASALREIAERRAAEVLPVLRTLFLEEFEPSNFVQEIIKRFISAREGPVTVCRRKSEWERHVTSEHDLAVGQFFEIDD